MMFPDLSESGTGLRIMPTFPLHPKIPYGGVSAVRLQGRTQTTANINRRVVITVTAPDGTVIGDGSIGSAIEDFITYSRGQLGKLDGILAQLQQLEAQVRALSTADIKQDTTQIRQDTGQ